MEIDLHVGEFYFQRGDKHCNKKAGLSQKSIRKGAMLEMCLLSDNWTFPDVLFFCYREYRGNILTAGVMGRGNIAPWRSVCSVHSTDLIGTISYSVFKIHTCWETYFQF